MFIDFYSCSVLLAKYQFWLTNCDAKPLILSRQVFRFAVPVLQKRSLNKNEKIIVTSKYLTVKMKTFWNTHHNLFWIYASKAELLSESAWLPAPFLRIRTRRQGLMNLPNFGFDVQVRVISCGTARTIISMLTCLMECGIHTFPNSARWHVGWQMDGGGPGGRNLNLFAWLHNRLSRLKYLNLLWTRHLFQDNSNYFLKSACIWLWIW